MVMTVILFAILISRVFPYKFPEKFERCHINDPELDSCLKSTIQNALELIGDKGIPSLNLPSIDPLKIVRLEIGAGTSAVHLIQKYSDIEVLGHATCTVKSAHLDIDQKVLTFTMHLPKVQQKAKYDVDGKVMVLPIFGKGESVVTLLDVMMTHTITFEEETKNNKLYFKIKSYKMTLSANGINLRYTNLFNGEEPLASATLKVLNDNAKDIFEDIKTGIESAYSEICKGVASRLFSAVPVHEIFLN